MTVVSCGECGKQVSDQAKSCPDCGHPVPVSLLESNDAQGSAKRAASMECRLMFALGIGIIGVGILAMAADSLLAAIVAIAVGVGTSLSAALGLWRGRY